MGLKQAAYSIMHCKGRPEELFCRLGQYFDVECKKERQQQFYGKMSQLRPSQYLKEYLSQRCKILRISFT
jgi:hypothetical protein